MKIGIDARMYSSGFTGIGRYVAELIHQLARIDENDEFIVFLNSPEFEDFVPPSLKFKKVRVGAEHYSFAEQIRFLRILRRERCDLVHFTHFNSPIFYRRPFITTIHDLTLSKYPGKKMNNFLHRAAYDLVLRNSVRKSRKAIAVSENTKKDLIEILKTPPSKVEVIHNGVGREFVPSFPTELSRRKLNQKFGITKSYFLYTGVWREHKNILGMLDALALLREQNWDGELVMTGRPNPVYAPEIFAKIRELNIGKIVFQTDLVSDSDLLQLYQNARVFVFPSFYEGFGLPPLEAMACGVPVAASNSSSIPEICDSAAEFFDPKNVPEMAEKMRRVWQDEALRKDLITMGARRILDFSWQKMAEKTLETYREAVLQK